MACLRTTLTPTTRTVYKFSLGLCEDDQKKRHRIIWSLKQYYGASIGVSGEPQKFLRLLQEENELIGAWESIGYETRALSANTETFKTS